MRAILINSTDRTITEVDVPKKGTLQAWYKLMNVELVKVVKSFGCDMLLVDEEGLMKENTLFAFDGQMLAGNGLVVGTTKAGGNKDCKSTIEQIKNRVKF
jgi:hypothetical protein